MPQSSAQQHLQNHLQQSSYRQAYNLRQGYATDKTNGGTGSAAYGREGKVIGNNVIGSNSRYFEYESRQYNQGYKSGGVSSNYKAGGIQDRETQSEDEASESHESLGLDYYQKQIAMLKHQQKLRKLDRIRQERMAKYPYGKAKGEIDMGLFKERAVEDDYSTEDGDEEDAPRHSKHYRPDKKIKRKRARKNKKKNKKTHWLPTLIKLTKIFFIVGSVIMISVAALRFSVLELQTVHAAIMNFYFLLLGVITALS